MPQTTTTKTPKTVSLTPRAVEALWRAVESMEMDDPKRLASVLVEIASEEIEQSSRFASRVGTLYRALEPVKRSPAPKATNQRQAKGLPEDIVPIKHVEGNTFDLGAPPDPYFLLDVYGSQQLPRVLNAYSPKALKEAVEIVQTHKPGTRPQKQTKAGLVDYIVEQVVQV